MSLGVKKKSRKSRKVQLSNTKERKKCSCKFQIGELGAGEACRGKTTQVGERRCRKVGHVLARGGSRRLKNTRMSACGSGLGKLVGARRPRWENDVAGKLAMCWRVVAIAD